MNKNNYTAPAVQVTQVNVIYHLLDPSIRGTDMNDGFSEDLEMGGSTNSADSRRRGSWWDED